MSRWIYSDDEGRIIEEIADMDECKHMGNEVCTNPDSEACCDFPSRDYCKHVCPFFTNEDGVITV